MNLQWSHLYLCKQTNSHKTIKVVIDNWFTDMYTCTYAYECNTFWIILNWLAIYLSLHEVITRDTLIIWAFTIFKTSYGIIVYQHNYYICYKHVLIWYHQLNYEYFYCIITIILNGITSITFINMASKP